MDPKHADLVSIFSTLFLRGGGMDLHGDAAKKDYMDLHWVRIVISIGGEGIVTYHPMIVNEGDELEVKVLEIDGRGRIRLSRKALLTD